MSYKLGRYYLHEKTPRKLAIMTAVFKFRYWTTIDSAIPFAFKSTRICQEAP